ncbi:MAG: PorT family protein [Saprospiraceae bacterium]|nr:PorT family protein [Saprospiraceae bacterium]
MKNLKFRLACLTILAILIWAPVEGQGRLSYGFKAGLNSSTFSGPLEEEESYGGSTGFHIGIIFKYPLTDLFGLKGEFVYNQRGGEYTYNGPSFFFVQRETNPILVSGTRNMNINVSNNYLDFPLLAYGRFGRFELSTGINISLLVGSFGGGQLKFTGVNPQISEFTFNLDQHYISDKAGEATPIGGIDIKIANETIRLPSQIGGYYEFPEIDGNKYNFLDLSWLAGVSFYINEGLYLGLRGNFGLVDATKKSLDVTYKTFSNNVPMLQNDVDKQITYQLSLGFSF